MVRFLSVALCLLALPTSTHATGLLWNLPEDGRYVSYEGTYTKQTTDGNPEITWLRNMTIKSVGKVDAQYKGVSEPCRWIEIKVVTGKKSETGLDPGPAGALLYKVLVPESKIVGDTKDLDNIPVSMIPIVKGYRRIGEGAVKPIKAKALQVYPSLSLLTHYKKTEVVAESDTPDVNAGAFASKHLKAKSVIERPTTEVSNSAEFWVSKELPFGLAKWKVTVTSKTKDLTDERAAFKEVSKVIVEMKAQDTGDRATSELSEQ